MANYQLNRLIKTKQWRVLGAALTGILLLTALILVLLVDGKPKKSRALPMNLTGIVNASFSEDNAESAMAAEQVELDSLKTQLQALAKTIADNEVAHKKALEEQTLDFQKKLISLAELQESKTQSNEPIKLANLQNPGLWHGKTLSSTRPTIHTVSFRPKKTKEPVNYLNATHYVPSNTSVRAVVLGGADADASVNGQSKNNGVMLFKFLEDGTLPNGQRSRLRGCRVSANAYGDISSERAFATLYHLSCAHPGQPIIDKEVTGWVFFNGKAGIKGQPLMRDNKVMQWAGMSGALSGIASAAQYAQSVQNIGALGATSVVPSNNMGPYAAYGGASKAADTLSQYYVKRAEQYHPVIQVGAGNVVTVVFKDGFYLEPIDSRNEPTHKSLKEAFHNTEANSTQEINFMVPPEVLAQIDKTHTKSQFYAGEDE